MGQYQVSGHLSFIFILIFNLYFNASVEHDLPYSPLSVPQKHIQTHHGLPDPPLSAPQKQIQAHHTSSPVLVAECPPLCSSSSRPSSLSCVLPYYQKRYAFDKQGWCHFKMATSLDTLQLILRAYNSLKLVQFPYMKTLYKALYCHWPFLFLPDIPAVEKTCKVWALPTVLRLSIPPVVSSELQTARHGKPKIRHLSLFDCFFISFSTNLYYVMTPSYCRLLWLIQNENTAPISVQCTQRSRFVQTAIYGEVHTDHKPRSCGCHISHV